MSKSPPDVRAMLEPYKDIFPDELLPCVLPNPELQLQYFKVRLTSKLPQRQIKYKPTADTNARLLKIVQGLEDKGLITRCMASFASPAFLVKKKEINDAGVEVKTGDRFVIDYRVLNRHTDIPISPFPDVRAIYDSMVGCNYFSIIDLRSGYHQILVDKETSRHLAFTTPLGVFRWNVMPFGPS